MPRSSLCLRAAVTAAGAAGALVAALAFPAAAGASTHQGRAALRLHTTHTKRVVAPATTHPGIVRLRDASRSPIMVIRAKRSGATRGDLAHRLNGNGEKAMNKRYRIVAFVTPRSSGYVHLGHGSYFLADADADTFHPSKIASMLVTGTRRDAALPTSYVTVITAHRHLFLPRDLPRNGYLHLENHSSDIAALLLLPVRAKTTEAALRNLVAHPSFEKIFTDARLTLRGFGLFSAAGPHSSLWPGYHETAGRYVVLATGSGFGLHRGSVRVVHIG